MPKAPRKATAKPLTPALAETRRRMPLRVTCMWPSGSGPFTFECPEPVQPATPYCREHNRLAYVPMRREGVDLRLMRKWPKGVL
jgi:hypothetical protein